MGVTGMTMASLRAAGVRCLVAGVIGFGLGGAASAAETAGMIGSWTIIADAEVPASDDVARPAGTQLPVEGSAAGASPQLTSFIEARMLERIPDDIEPYFDILMYVSRATRGPYAQRMYVFEREPGDAGYTPYAQWLVSTGREQHEKHWTGTPDGLFKMDHRRFYKHRVSFQWGTPMPWTMFFDAQFDGKITGYAIHGASSPDDVAMLGARASAGCIRLHPEHAENIFTKIRREAFGRVPVFAVDRLTQTTDLDGQAVYRKDGRLLLRRGFRALLMVEDFEGGPAPRPDSDVIVSAY